MAASRVTARFTGSQGVELAGRLDLPTGPPRATVVFAHCFTCGKDLRSASRISAGLTEHGFAVLRFDMTGLGGSDGDFANTDLSSNVADLVAAANWLGEHHQAPQLLVGHSLGGAAAVLAAASLESVQAVVTIGSPADADHLTHLFSGVTEQIIAEGQAPVTIAGRSFTIRSEFLDDLQHHRVQEAAGSLRRALLILHSPIDEVVSVDHAATLYRAARHPKSFVALDGADHLLSDPRDAGFAASVIATWAERYVLGENLGMEPPSSTAQVVVAETGLGPFHNHVVSGRHRFVADEPEAVGGFDAGPSPYDLLAAALGTCTTMTLRMYADRKGLEVSRVSVEVAHDKVHASEVSEVAAERSGGRPVDRFTRTITIEGDLDAPTRQRLAEIADRCPVHRTLEQSSVIETTLAQGAS